MTTKKATKPKGGLDCPNCEFHIDAATVARAWFGDPSKSGRKKILRPCPKGCGLELGAREMRVPPLRRAARYAPGTPPANRHSTLRVNQPRAIELTRKGPTQLCPARACFATK
jgi:hypothetical protein